MNFDLGLQGPAKDFRDELLNLQLLIQDKSKQIEDLKRKTTSMEHAMRLEKKAVEDAKKSASAAQLASLRLETELTAEKATVADLRSQLVVARSKLEDEAGKLRDERRNFTQKYDSLAKQLFGKPLAEDKEAEEEDKEASVKEAVGAKPAAGDEEAEEEDKEASFKEQLGASRFLKQVLDGSQAILGLVEQTWRDQGLSYSESKSTYGNDWEQFYEGYRAVQQAAQEAGLVVDSEEEVCDSDPGEDVMVEEPSVY